MPARRPRASFEPLPPDFNLQQFVEDNPNFDFIDRISVDAILEQDPSMSQLEKLVVQRVILEGKPLVIDGFDSRLDPWIFTERWLRDNHGDKEETARDLTKKDSLPLTIGHYLKNLPKLAEQFFKTPDAHLDPKKQRVYLKDIDCPPVWHDKLREHIPPFLFYWNDSTGEVGGPGAITEKGRPGKGAAHAGDLMSMLPREMRADNLMCYIGHEGTYTPAHREMCASLGQNIMVEASEQYDENGDLVKPGSSIWFMTERKDREVVAEYWLSVLGHDIEVETHFAQLAAWRRAPFKVWVVEQRPGDFILVPPLAPHQVWNRGTRTMKVAWNRTTVETLEMAFDEALPKARMVCRDEQYKNKAIVYYTLLHYSNLLKIANLNARQSPVEAERIFTSKKLRQLQKDFKRLFKMFKDILLSEMWAPDTREHCEFLAFDSNVTCSYCRGNIFNRFLTCKNCADIFNPDVEEPYDICMECYVMGRSCGCQSNYKFVEQFKWKDLVARYEEWRQQVIQIDARDPPLALLEARRQQDKKTIAEICQEQLKLRPFIDPKKPKPLEPEEYSEEEIEVDENGVVKNVRKKRSKEWRENRKSCHVCLQRHPKWMMAFCTMCERAWCYGSLWRAHELLPQQIMEDKQWECPHCRKVCSTGKCRQDPRQKPYEPKHTMLGHDTKKVADPRSVELLVDFSVSNLNWLKEKAEDQSHSNKRLRHQVDRADRDKMSDALLDDENYVDGFEDEGVSVNTPDGYQIHYEPPDPNIDPALMGSIQNDSSTATVYGAATQWNAVNSGPDFDRTMCDIADNGFLSGGARPSDQYVAPTAVMLTPEAGRHFNMASPSTFDGSLETSSYPQKRQPDAEPIKLVSSKKRKVGDSADATLHLKTLNKASKQYQLAQIQKRLDEASKQGRFLQIYAAIHGKRKMIKLKVDSQKLALIAARAKSVETTPALDRTQTRLSNATASDTVLLKSNLVPSNSADPPRGGASKSKRYRFRVEDDEDFRIHSTMNSDTGKKPKNQRLHYEEVTVDTDEDIPARITPSGPTRRRRPLYMQRRDGDEDLPDELPEDFKDGQLRALRRKERRNERAHLRAEQQGQGAERRRTLPSGNSASPASRPQAMKAPRIRPAGIRASTGSMELDDDDVDIASPVLAANMSGHIVSTAATAQEIARLAMLEAENTRAKLDAAAMVSDLVEEFAINGDVETSLEDNANRGTLPTPVQPAATNGSLTHNSIMAKRPKKKLSPSELRRLGKTIKGTSRPRKPQNAVREISSDSSSDSFSNEGQTPPKAPAQIASTAKKVF